ncbi:hypothetical protein FE257_009438 [Aspergillus nanangensis]|uniref:Uncharacterized protein n=1 Tax=Aspergillus nanangensis TaxID=2582783 RepID=A0AAD4CJX7_ASPNN|nr:hypothetical protein FE257_009438 [Aspergillus nanangensis]
MRFTLFPKKTPIPAENIDLEEGTQSVSIAVPKRTFQHISLPTDPPLTGDLPYRDLKPYEIPEAESRCWSISPARCDNICVSFLAALVLGIVLVLFLWFMGVIHG